MRAVALLTAALALAIPAAATAATPSRALPATTPAAQTAAVAGILDAFGRGVGDLQRAASAPPARRRPASLTEREATGIAEGSGRLQDWIADHRISRTAASLQDDDVWKVSFISKKKGGAETVEAEVYVSDDRGEITEVRTGPQVGWFMARGHDGAFGRSLNKPAIWTALCVAFLLPLVRFRRILSWRTLDLLAILGFTVSWIWFQMGEIFTSVPLQYVPLVYLGARLTWIGVRRSRDLARAEEPAEQETGEIPVVQAAAEADPADDAAQGAPTPAGRPQLANWCPTWLVVAVLVAALVLRWGLNAFNSNVIDVGYAGVIGADLIQKGETPYGNFPADCGRCDTYGPLTYITYVPFRAALGWTGKWDDLPAAHGAATFFDLLALTGMLVLGRRLGGWRLGAILALAWATVPWTAYALESNANDALVGAVLAWGLAFAAMPLVRGLAVGLATAAKFTPAILLPLWYRHPFPRAPREGARRRALLVTAGAALAVLLTGWVLLLDGLDGVRSVWSRTIGYQADRESPFSLWGQYPGLRPVQIALGALVLVAALALVRWPRRMDLLSMAAFSGALLIGAQLTLEHWFYLYIPWFLPFVLMVVVPEWPARPAPRRERAREAVPGHGAGALPVAS